MTDIGSNIGMFSVAVANLGRKVVAVDASIENLAYIDKSIHLNNKAGNVKLINNAVRSIISINFPISNFWLQKQPK